MNLEKVKLSFHRGLATGLLVLVSMTVPATLLAAKVEHASIASVASQGNSEVASSAASVSSSSRGDEDAASDEVGAGRPAFAGLFDVETNSGLLLLDSAHRRNSSFTTAPAARFDSERRRNAGRRAAAGTLGGLRILQRVFSNGQAPRKTGNRE